MPHTCHAIACKTAVRPEMFMCVKHWFMVPPWLRKMIWRFYRPGQCDDLNPSLEYCETAKKAVTAVAEKEGRTITGSELELKLYDAFIDREREEA